MGQWILPGPDGPTLTREQVAAMLHVSTQTLDRMVAAGRFPAGIKPSTKAAPIWTGADLAAWLHLAGRMNSEVPGEGDQEDSQ